MRLILRSMSRRDHKPELKAEGAATIFYVLVEAPQETEKNIIPLILQKARPNITIVHYSEDATNSLCLFELQGNHDDFVMESFKYRHYPESQSANFNFIASSDFKKQEWHIHRNISLPLSAEDQKFSLPKEAQVMRYIFALGAKFFNDDKKQGSVENFPGTAKKKKKKKKKKKSPPKQSLPPVAENPNGFFSTLPAPMKEEPSLDSLLALFRAK